LDFSFQFGYGRGGGGLVGYFFFRVFQFIGGQVVIVTAKSRYEGGYNAGKPHGYGVLTKANGTVYKGNWTNGCLKINTRGDMIALNATAAECSGIRR
jgi:hypothetical protein